MQRWPLWFRLAVMGVALSVAYVAQIPLERDWPGEPFLLFLLVVIGTTLCFGTRIGLLSVALSTFFSIYFFEPVGSPTLRYASDLDKILVYALLALGCVVGFSHFGNAFIKKSDGDKHKSVLLLELAHRVANNFAAIAALIEMKSDSVSDTKAKSVLDDAIEQVKVMAGVHRRLHAGGQDASLDSKAFIHELCDDLRASMALGRPISIQCNADSLALCIDDAVSLGLIINELVTNATKHAFPDLRVGRIRVAFEVQDGQSYLSVEDDGVGFDDRRNVGMGEDLVRGLSRQLGGNLRVKSSKAGSTFRLSIPHLSPATQPPVTTSRIWKPRFRVTVATHYRTTLKRVGAHVKNAASNMRANILTYGLCREAIEVLPAAVYMTDAEGRITLYNEAAVALWGCRPKLGDSKFCGSWKLYSPDGTPLPHDECPMALALRQKRPIRGIEAVAERPDGTRIPFIPYPTPLFDATGRLTGAVNMLVDISERKRAEQALADLDVQRALAGKAALVGSYVYDVKGAMQVSEGYAAIHGLPEGTTETSYGEWRARVHPEDLERAEGIRDQAFADRRKEDNAEYRIVLSTGEIRWIERRGSISYDGHGRPERVVGVNIDITERKRAEERQRVLLAELDHRVKNMLATVSAVASRTQDANGSVEGFVAALDGRIRSMATAHELLSTRQWKGMPMAELIRRELAAHATSNNTEIEGPEVILNAEAGQATAMVIHELVSNAAKYGALSTQSGRVSVQWYRKLNGSAQLVLEWQETGGPRVEAPRKSGYGTSVVRDLIPYEFGGTVDFSFAPEGVQCRLEIPFDRVSGDSRNGAGSGELHLTK
jgi:PAS domain S-box-containing protein